MKNPDIGGGIGPRLRVVAEGGSVSDAQSAEKMALIAKVLAMIEGYVGDRVEECLAQADAKNSLPKTPKARRIDSGERYIFAGEKRKTVDYLGRLSIDGIGCFESDYAGRKTVYVSSRKNPEGQTMAMFTRYPVTVDGWERGDLRHYKMGTLNFCEMFGIPHTNADFKSARENGRCGYKVLVKGFGHFAVVLPQGKENSLNLAPLSSYPSEVFSILNAKINAFLTENPEYSRLPNGGMNGIPQFGEEDLARILGDSGRE